MKVARIRVFDMFGNDVTSENIWYIDMYGRLCFETEDIDEPVKIANECEYRYEIKVR